MPKSPTKKITKASSSKSKPNSLGVLIDEQNEQNEQNEQRDDQNATQNPIGNDPISIHSEGSIIEQAKNKLKNLEKNPNVNEAEFNADLEKQTAYR